MARLAETIPNIIEEMQSLVDAEAEVTLAHVEDWIDDLKSNVKQIEEGLAAASRRVTQ